MTLHSSKKNSEIPEKESVVSENLTSNYTGNSLGGDAIHNLFSQAPVAICIFRGGNHIVELVNDKMLELWNKKHEDVIEIEISKSIPEVTEQGFETILNNVFQKGERFIADEVPVSVSKKGIKQLVYVNYVYEPLRNHSGEVTGIMAVANDITDLVLAKQEIEYAEERSRLSAAAADLGTFDLDVYSNKLIYSDKLREIFGYYEHDKLLDREDILKVIHPDDRHIRDAAHTKSLETGDLKYEVRLLLNDGSIRWINAHGKIFFDKNKKPFRVLGTIKDITAEKTFTINIEANEQKLKDEEERLRLATEGTKLSTWDLNLQTYDIIHSPRLAKIFGYPKETILSHKQLRAHVHPDDQKNIVEVAFAEALKTGDYYYEARIIRPDQSIRWIRTQGKVLFSPSKEPVRILGTLIDVTDQRLAEKKTEENEIRLKIILEASELGTWDLNLIDNTIIYSDKYLEILGFSKSKTQPKLEELVSRIHPDDLKIRKAAFEEAFKTGILSYIARLVWPDQTIHWIEAKGKVFYNDKKEPVKMIGTARDLTGERFYQQRIEESEKRFRTIADTAPVLIWMSGTDQKCNFCNKAWLEFTGKNIEDETGSGWMDGIHSDDLKRCLEINSLAFEKKEEFYLEYRLRRHDGEFRWVSDKGTPRFTSDGKFEGYVGACMDIHDRIIFEEKLKESESRLRIAALSSELGTWNYDPATKILTWDSASRELFGVDPDTPITLELFWAKMHAEDRDPALQKMLRAMDPTIADTYDVEYRVIGLPEDKTRWIHAKGKAIFENNIPVLFSGTVLDITEKRLALEELRKNEERFRLLADSMAQFIWTSDPQGNLNYFNKTVYDYSGLLPEELKKDGWIQIVHPDDREGNIKTWIESVLTGEDFLFEHRFKRKDGEYRWQLSRAIPQRDSKGNIQMWVGTSTDINEIKKHEEQKDDFIKIASHELKTPVTTIKGYVQLLMKMNNSESESFLSSSLSTIDKQVSKLTKLISDLLDVTKIETGSLRLNKEHFHISEIINELVKDFQNTTTSHKIQLRQKGDAKLFADRDRISQVLINLFTNAIKYSPNGDQVNVMIESNDYLVTVSVQDFGIGIEQKDHERIFERFYRATGKDENTFPGFGIGLFIVNEIVTLHKGKIWVESEPHKGSTFYFSLPVH